ncbi:unnamed protein product [Menidia menidia]|uniref:(Atlantic silverside) hypothetical protein n=1 Tax=Menidia menidia TaxID=238744 RepID=A0A8S4AIE8_9TELE|nr:unnamed protein product [Menidia menidia]
MTFNPRKISLQKSQNQCEHGDRRSACVNATVCFHYHVKSDNKARDEPAEMGYTLVLDALRALSRATVIDGDKSDRKISRTFQIRHGEGKCMKETIMMSSVLDFRDPLLVSLKFGPTKEDQGPVLDESLPKSINKTIPLVDCGDDKKCITDLSLKAKPSVKSAVIKATAKDKIDVNVSVKNKRDNAYNTRVVLSFTPNVDYVKVEPEMVCTLNHTRLECAVGYPFLGNNVEEHFKVRFETNPKHIQEEIQIQVKATSDSEEQLSTLGDNSVHISIPVKYEAGVIFTVDYTEVHVEVAEGEQHAPSFNDTSMIGEEVNINYKVEKSGDMATPPLRLTVAYPKLSPLKNRLLYLTHVTTSPKVKCEAAHLINPDKIGPGVLVPKPKKETLGFYVLQCGATDCASFRCLISEANTSQVNVTFRVWKPTFIKGEFSSLSMMVNATLNIENAHLFELGSNERPRSVRIQVSKQTVGGIPIWIIILSILIGLLILALVIFILWRLGFFKRKSPNYSEKEDMMD